jgi:hypothetical protein
MFIGRKTNRIEGKGWIDVPMEGSEYLLINTTQDTMGWSIDKCKI